MREKMYYKKYNNLIGNFLLAYAAENFWLYKENHNKNSAVQKTVSENFQLNIIMGVCFIEIIFNSSL